MIFTAKRLVAAAVPLLMASATVLVPAVSRADPEPTSALIAAGRQALVRGDGIDAEMKLRAALDRGVPRRQLAAFLGSAYLRQGDRARAREWLATEDFSAETAAEGLRVLAQLEQLDGDLVAAGRAYDKALRITPRDAGLWVEIGRLRYRQGEHLQAIQAADHALAIDRRNARALEFRGQLVRDRHGLLAGLPWFEAALLIAPDDITLLGNYAATLGELGRASEMLVVTRRMLELEPGNAQAYYLQAVMAARAGKFDVARSLFARTGGKRGSAAGSLMLQAILELSAGNMRVAAEACERLLKLQPANMRARELLARTLYLSGQYNYLTLRFRGDIARGDASPYLMSVVARAFEAEGNHEQAGVLLDRAAAPAMASLRVVPQGSDVGALMSQGRTRDAIAAAEQQRATQPGSYQSYAILGDMELALGHAQNAQLQYTAASRIRMSDSLLSRRFQAYLAAGDAAGAAAMMQSWLAQNPNSRTGLRLQASLALQAGDPATAGAILSYLSSSGGDQDVQLLSDLALVRLQGGTPDVAEQAAGQAYRLQRASPLATQALALSYATLAVNSGEAWALLAKARQMLGDNPILSQAEARLQQRRLPVLATAEASPR